MKKLTLLVISLLAGLILHAQEKSPIPKISQQISEYSKISLKNKVFITTDKSRYKPGETIWFSAFITDENNISLTEDNSDFFVKLYDKNGSPVVQAMFRINRGSVTGDMQIPENLPKGNYFLVAYNSTNSLEKISFINLNIDPEYLNQWVAETFLKDSISSSGKRNELLLILRDVSGDVQKNTLLRYQFMNGMDFIEKGKVRTDEKGQAVISLNIPSKTNGEPFTCILTDARNDWEKEVFIPSDIDPLLVKFFPEGGNISTGISTKIGFTAFNKWGIPVEVEGSIINQGGKSINQVKTFTKGMGIFSIKNENNERTALALSGKLGHGQSFGLPASNTDGINLSVVKSDTAFISVNLNFADNKKHSVAMTATRSNKLYWAADMEIDGIGRIKIPSENLPQGIILLSVFSQDGQLLSDRIVFADKKQQLKIAILPEKTSMETNSVMKVKVKLTDENNQPLSGNVAVAISDKYRSEPRHQTIDEFLVLNSELETPFSLMGKDLKSKLSYSALDAFLISNRLKNFDWAKIRQPNTENESENLSGNKQISGVVTDKNGTKVYKAKVSLVNNMTMQLHTTTTNSDGYFSFPNLNMVNAEDFSAKATDQDGKRDLILEFSKNFENKISERVADLSRKYSLLNKNQIIDETYYRNNQDLYTRAPKQLMSKNSQKEIQQRYLQSSTNLMDVIKTIKPYNIINNQIVFNGSVNSINYQGGALIIVDGLKMGTEISIVQNITPIEVDHINISTNPMDIQRYTGFNSVGIIEIFLKNSISNDPFDRKESDTTNSIVGYKVPREFEHDSISQKNDLQTTLLWIPNQKVDDSGEFEFSVSSGKIISDFVIEVQGISDNGRLGDQKSIFSVTK